MVALPHLSSRRQRGAALIIVLAFVVLLTGLMVAYLSRTTSDRQVAQVSFTQTKVDQVAASGMDLVIGGLRQEITGPNPTPTPPYFPLPNANMLPLRFGNPNGSPDPIPNLIRRSVQGDGPTGANPIPSPGIPSFASAVNSTTDISANGRSIILARWNKHYLLPKYNTASDDDIPSSPLLTPFNPNPPVVNGFRPPDWVIVTRAPSPAAPTVYPIAFSTWDPALADQTPTNNSCAIGRYAYAIYDEGQLLDVNAAGYPSGTTAAQAGRKGPVAFADLTVLPYPFFNPDASGIYQSDMLVGWRNYGSAQPTNNFPNTNFGANFRAGPNPAAAYWTSIINNISAFTRPSSASTSVFNGRTDQMFLSRQQLIAYRAATPATLFNVNALQYLSTFSRELNAPSWKPSTPPTGINPDLLNVRATNIFTRADGTPTAVGDLLIKRRFPLSRINGLADPTFAATTNSTINNGFLVPATAATVQRDFGLVWNSGSPAGSVSRWDYVGATGTTVQSSIETLAQVAAENPGREPNFFELLKAGILNGSVGLGSSGATFVAAETKYYSTPFSSDHQIMQIGANIIDQWNPFYNSNPTYNIPTFIGFKDPVTSTIYEIAGIKNLPYLNKLVFKPAWTGPKSGTYTFDAWLIPSLWNPHQNAPPAPQNIQIAMTSGTFTASTSPSLTTAPIPITGSATQFMTVDASKFPASIAAPTPSAPTAASIVKPPNPPPAIILSTDAAPGPYYGFHVVGTTTTAPTSSTTAQPNFGAANFELQVQVGGKTGPWKTYQKWMGCAQPATPLTCNPTGLAGNTTLQDPEFVTLDPRTLRFGVWGNDAFHSASPLGIDYTTGVLTTLDQSVGSPPATGVYEAITALPPQGASFTLSTSPYALYNFANNTSSTVYYKDLDTLQRAGDLLTTGMTTAMQPADWKDRPQILNRPFQSVAELGQVFRDQPWKTLDFGDFVSTTVPGPDAGLLDVFTLHESANEGGKTSLNTRYQFILTAILSNAIKRLSGTGVDVITPAQRDAIVTDLFGITSTQPMIRKTDLLTQLATKASVTGLGNKEARELVIRAFSDACQTRTWNLMIDVIAQSGRYPTSANSLAGFLVEGEQHYWVHVAIDRFTGQVIDKQIEVVNE